MKYIEEFRNPEKQRKIVELIIESAKFINFKITLMEVCGTHTITIGKYGIRKLMPKNIHLVSGPGCPVCVTPVDYIDIAIELSKRNDVIVTTFGDLMRVPGSFSTLEKEKANGGKIVVLYSPFDALNIAKKYPDKNIIFLSVGFETTTPSIAQTIKFAKRERIKNFYVLVGNKLIPPILEFLLKKKEININGFICPGHVSVIIGTEAYKFIPEKYKIPCVISGFEPLDILYSIYLLLKCIIENKIVVINEYKRAVKDKGNTKAKEMIYEIFDVCDSEWRGIGIVPKSGLKLKEEFLDFDVLKKFKVEVKRKIKNNKCLCGEILKGTKLPFDCPLFGKKCTPENPVGPCMVSSEGTCSAYFKYERK
ncbi:MAG: hydrogenase formation protein HypD [Candidatus Omnitrophica bacterium]|nr:hydrogenase formation protein HypD [Candidatus Omnitrophota bacterium]